LEALYALAPPAANATKDAGEEQQTIDPPRDSII